MKSTQLLRTSVMALAALAASATFAAGLTREQVRAEYFAARAADALPVGCEFDVHNPQKVVITSASAMPRAGTRVRAAQVINERSASDWQPPTMNWQPN
jgi:hypothetical protein